ncbi:MAG: methylated-DNA--[protein]-cysteine S-methyltransferase [Proteobacteria bacterium]|nr:methylated-DNA--[protein]-cysteine S-methyltransferase [Pseudomonadota bacterium]
MILSQLFVKQTNSPLGSIYFVATDRALTGLYLETQSAQCTANARRVNKHDVIDFAIAELTSYFGGGLTSFSTPIEMSGTAFQKTVWNALLDIPFGETRSYSELAEKVGKPRAARAVGTANGKNPLGIFVPCHRVIGADGSLTGYAGGIANKRWLLAHESAVVAGSDKGDFRAGSQLAIPGLTMFLAAAPI